MIKHIFLRQVLEEIEKKDNCGNAIPFDIEVWTFNKNNKSGGVLKKYVGAKLLMGEKIKGKKFVEAEHFYRPTRIRKNPNHWNNKTRNVELASGHIRKLNILYIKKFNGLHVIY